MSQKKYFMFNRKQTYDGDDDIATVHKKKTMSSSGLSSMPKIIENNVVRFECSVASRNQCHQHRRSVEWYASSAIDCSMKYFAVFYREKYLFLLPKSKHTPKTVVNERKDEHNEASIENESIASIWRRFDFIQIFSFNISFHSSFVFCPNIFQWHFISAFNCMSAKQTAWMQSDRTIFHFWILKRLRGVWKVCLVYEMGGKSHVKTWKYYMNMAKKSNDDKKKSCEQMKA